MDVVKCDSCGKYFDQDSFNLCPHCLEGHGFKEDASKPKKERHSLFGKKKSENSSAINGINNNYHNNINNLETIKQYDDYAINSESKSSSSSGKSNKTYSLSEFENNQKQNENKNKNYDYNSTFDVWSGRPSGSNSDVDRKQVQGSTQSLKLGTEIINNNEDVINPIGNYEHETVRDLVNETVAKDEGKTFGFFSLNKNSSNSGSEDSGSGTPQPTSVNSEPMVGWLVCIKGPHFGEAFNIYVGNNSIGRLSSNKIVIARDSHVSREKHAVITYEPKKREFLISPGASSGLTYLNDENIMTSAKLKAKDKIELGECVFLLIPLCGEDFSWEDYIN